MIISMHSEDMGGATVAPVKKPAKMSVCLSS
ncbi:MAG: hypothetical protein ACJASN_003022 [Cyclobacteriaceae bacterium]|jgi:hypothetical protein